MSDTVDWLGWTAGFFHSDAQWGVSMFRSHTGETKDSADVPIQVDIRVEVIIDSNEWLLFKDWTFPSDNQIQAQEWFDELVRRLGTLNDTSEGHPAVVLADDEMEITDQFRIQVFEEWLTGARAALSQ
ncbi:MAG: hypothetical protein RTU92_04760 [Candidatus Thorarchaeota archaeon]